VYHLWRWVIDCYFGTQHSISLMEVGDCLLQLVRTHTAVFQSVSRFIDCDNPFRDTQRCSLVRELGY
jgi:hypothetical protein